MKTLCECCQKRRAGGGQRFCWRCLGEMLSQPAPRPQAIRIAEGTYSYPDWRKAQ